MPRLREHHNKVRDSLAGCIVQKQSKEMKTPFSIFFDGSCIQILNESALIEQFNERYKPECYLDCEAQEEYQAKSSQAMGYFWGELAVKALSGLQASGYDVSKKEAAIDFILPELPSGRWVTEVKRFGKAVKTSPISIGSLSKKELHELTDELIRFIAEWFGLVCEDPATWLERKRKK